MKKVDESDISIELTQKAIDITNLADDFIKMSQVSKVFIYFI